MEGEKIIVGWALVPAEARNIEQTGFFKGEDYKLQRMKKEVKAAFNPYYLKNF